MAEDNLSAVLRRWTLPDSPLTPRDGVILLLLALLAFFGNMLPIPLMFGVDVLLGGIFVYITLLRYSTLCALLVGLPGFWATFLLWDHPYAAYLLTLEIIVLGYLCYRLPQRELPLLMVYIWVPVGAALGFYFYFENLDLPLIDASMVALKQAINSIANAAVAVVLYLLAGPYLFKRSNKRIHAREALFYLPALLTILVVTLMLFIISQVQLRVMNQEIERRLAQSQISMLDQTERMISQLEADLGHIQSRCLSEPQAGPESAQCVLNMLPFSHWEQIFFQPGSIGGWFSIRDDDGGWQPSADEHLTSLDLNAGYRVTDDGEIYLAKLHELAPDVWMAGTLNARLNAADLWQSSPDPSQRQVWHLDGQDIVSSAAPLSEAFSGSLSDRAQDNTTGMYHAKPDIPGMNRVNEWARSVYFKEVSFAEHGLPLPGTLRLELSPRVEQERMYLMYSVILALALAFILISLFASKVVTRWVTTPMQMLVDVARRIPQQLNAPPDSWDWPERSSVQEMDALQRSLQQMSRLLHAQHQQDQERRESLEQEVLRRTQDLEEAQFHINSILMSMDGVLWSVDLSADDMRLSLVSPSAWELTGFSAEAWLSQTQDLFARVRDAQGEVAASALQGLRTQQNAEFEVQFQHARGHWCWFRVRHWLVFDADSQPIRVDGLVTDVTEWHRAEEKIREQETLLVHQSRRAAMGEMVSNIAHQWRQPLNSLRLMLANLRDAGEYGELTDEYLDASLEKGDELIAGMNQTVRDFLTFFRPLKEPEEFSLAHVVEQAVGVMENTVSDYPVKVVFAGGEGAQVVGYPNELLQALMVLMQNAREIIVERSVGQGVISVGLERGPEEACVVVLDNGGGIDEHIMDHIFDPYFTTRSEGTGIGLYMAKALIENQMGGRMSADNRDAGAEFRICLPVVPQEGS